MLYIGSHVGFNKDTQILGSLEEALSYNETTFMFYTGAPQNTNRSKINKEMVILAKKKIDELNLDYSKIIVHAPYIINLASPDIEKRNFAIRFLKEEILRCEELGIENMVLHPGSHTGGGEELGIKNIIDGLNQVLDNSSVRILLETMAGKGTEVGRSFDELKKIIDGVKNKKMIGVCLDTCHLNDAAYDLNKFDQILDGFDQKIGLKYIYCIHINDSKNEFNSHKDRHENIGFGSIGFDTLLKIIYNKRLGDIPRILETPYVNEKPPYKEEIEMIRSKKFDPKLKENLL